jgi:hypothetical protein
MRFQYAFGVSKLLRDLKEAGIPLRRMIEALQKNPFLDDALKVEGYADRYEVFVAGYWIVYEIDQSNPSEMVIRVILIEAN